MAARNIYFELTRELNAEGPIAALASGQAVVYYRLAMMSKEGDWVLSEAHRRAVELAARMLPTNLLMPGDTAHGTAE